jgi:hypothetical protein
MKAKNPRWARGAKENRDLALMECAVGLRNLEPMINTRFTREHELQRLATGVLALRKIKELLDAIQVETEEEYTEAAISFLQERGYSIQLPADVRLNIEEE